MRKKQLIKRGQLEIDFSKPLDISLNDIGSNKDPCFGKVYDLSTEECRACGDSELCAVVMGQNLHLTRKQLNEKSSFKDMDVLYDIDSIRKYMRSLKRNGVIRKDIIKKSREKFSLPKSDIIIIYKKQFKKEK